MDGIGFGPQWVALLRRILVEAEVPSVAIPGRNSCGKVCTLRPGSPQRCDAGHGRNKPPMCCRYSMSVLCPTSFPLAGDARELALHGSRLAGVLRGWPVWKRSQTFIAGSRSHWKCQTRWGPSSSSPCWARRQFLLCLSARRLPCSCSWCARRGLQLVFHEESLLKWNRFRSQCVGGQRWPLSQGL